MRKWVLLATGTALNGVRRVVSFWKSLAYASAGRGVPEQFERVALTMRAEYTDKRGQLTIKSLGHHDSPFVSNQKITQMTYRINEVDGTDPDESHLIRHFNGMVLDWPIIEPRHLEAGYWWIIHADRPVGFAGMVPFIPSGNVHYIGYMKRCYLLPEARGNGLQIRTLFLREAKAQKLGWKQIVSETKSVQSAGNFIKAGYSPFMPEQAWGPEGSLYFTKML